MVKLVAGILLLSVAEAFSQTSIAQPDPPKFSLEVTNETAEAGWHPLLHTDELPGFSLTPSLRAGVMALTQTMPYQVMDPSPYYTGGLGLVYTGAFELS